ncbi:MAG: hypothetical protein Q8L55_03325, partial [Phycisphaerales bacterium]|nr:hypothetical protein [Phycisphaerales bacterium]
QALKAAKNKGVRAGDMADMTKEHSRAIDEHGPTDNFGAFVQGKLDQGLRGQALSDAIRAEHAARGKGKGAIKNTGKGKDKDKVAKERDAKDREKNEKDREKEKREKDAREKAEKAEKESKDVKEKEPKGNGKGKGN